MHHHSLALCLPHPQQLYNIKVPSFFLWVDPFCESIVFLHLSHLPSHLPSLSSVNPLYILQQQIGPKETETNGAQAQSFVPTLTKLNGKRHSPTDPNRSRAASPPLCQVQATWSQSPAAQKLLRNCN